MSNAQFSAGQARAEGEAQADRLAGTVSDMADAVADRTSEAGQHAQERQEHASGFVQQTGEHLKSMAEDVKNTLGVGNAGSQGKP